MKKLLSLLAAVLLLISTASGCAQAPQSSTAGLRIVATIFPAYDWVREILGKHAATAELTLLLDNGVDLHSYQPTAEDRIRIASCDLFIYVGGESDQWADKLLQDATNPNRQVINMLEVLGDAVMEEEIVEGMEADHDHEEDSDTHEEEPAADEHVWLSVKNAGTLCARLADTLAQLDSDHAAAYQANADSYAAQLSALDARYQAIVDAATGRTLVFCDRFPFRYLTEDYGLSYYAAFTGCSAETEASFETIAFLADKIDELALHCVITIEGSDQRIAQAVIANTRDKNQTVLSLDSMQSVTATTLNEGTSYIAIMESNAQTLQEALA